MLPKFSLKKSVRTITTQIAKSIEKDQDDLYFKIRRGSPVDTGLYVKGHRKKAVRIKGTTVTAVIENAWPYPLKVEDWWRKTPVNWHLLDGRIIRQKGAKVYERATDGMRGKVISNIRTSIW